VSKESLDYPFSKKIHFASVKLTSTEPVALVTQALDRKLENGIFTCLINFKNKGSSVL